MENKKRKNFYGYFGKSKSTYAIGEDEKEYYLEKSEPRAVSIGNEFFREIREKNYFYIDKSLYIKNIIDDASKVVLITRPRRFGKTLNMDMLKCFFNIEEDSKEIFKGLKIMEQGENYTNYLNSMPVIYLTLKDVMGGSFETMIALLKTCISNMYKQHNNLLDNKKLRTQQRERVRKYIDKEMEKEELLSSINELAELLESVYGKKVLLLLDEYDVPLQNAYVSGFYEEAIEYLKIFYANSFKGNAYIEKAVLTGVSRVSKETIFSGLNNIEVYTVINDNIYGKDFGMVDEEVEKALEEFELEKNKKEVKKWYDGYKIGNTEGIYNPWSLTKYLKDKQIQAYWVNTSSNDLIKLIFKKSVNAKQMLEKLLEGKKIEVTINEETVLKNIERNEENMWGLLVGTGYLKINKILNIKQVNVKTCLVEIPNEEIRRLFESIIELWFLNKAACADLQDLLSDLINGKFDEFEYKFQRLVIEMFSYMDVGIDTAENFYHAFVLGLLVGLKDTHTVVSNRESGYGRYDIMVKPKDKNQIAFIMEFKVDKFDKIKDLDTIIESAFNQIEEKKYETELRNEGYTNISKMAYSFKGKDCKMAIR